MEFELVYYDVSIQQITPYATVTSPSSKFTKLFASMWLKAEWMGCPMRLELTCVGLLI